MSDRIEALFDEYLGLALAGKALGVDEFLASKTELGPGERERFRELAQSLAGGMPRPRSEPSARPGGGDFRLAQASGRLGDLGPFRLLRELGRGGQGIVYLAVDMRLERRVALKVLLGTDVSQSEPAERLRREAALASKLEHPGICTIHEIGSADNVLYVAMRFIEGETLSLGLARARERGLEHYDPRAAQGEAAASAAQAGDGAAREGSLMECVRFLETIARALHAAHEAKILHRDVKPANIMVTPQGEPVLLDFGVARNLGADATALTVTGFRPGSPAYSSPEQLTGTGGELDRRTDIYSLGVVLFECLTTRRPFESPTPEGLYHQVLHGPTPDPRRINPRLGRDLSTIISSALEKERERRYPTALALAEDLRRVREFQPILARPAGPILRAKRWVRRNLWPALTAASVLAFGLILAFALRPDTSESDLRLRAATARGRVLLEQRDGSRANFEQFAHAIGEARSIDSLDDELANLVQASSNAYGGELEQALQRGLQAARDPESALQDCAQARETVERLLQVQPGSTFVAQSMRRISSAAQNALSRRSANSGASPATPGRLRVLGTPAAAEAWLFEYRPHAEFRTPGEPRLVPAPVATAEGAGAFVWPLLAEAPESYAGFCPGDLVLAIEAVEPGSLGESLGLRRNDCIVAIAGRAIDARLVVESDAQQPARYLPFDPVVRLGSVDDPTEFERDLILGPALGNSAVEALVESASGTVAIAVQRRGREPSPRMLSLQQALEAELPAEGVELLVLSQGRLRKQVCPGRRRLGLSLLLSANPLVFDAGNLLGSLSGCSADPAPGSYLLVARAPGYADLRLPFVVEADRSLELRADLLSERDALPGFLHVAAGECEFGEKVSNVNVRAREKVWLDEFWIARKELTIAEYLEFLHDDSARLAIEEGKRQGTHLRIPRKPETGQLYWRPLCSILPGWRQVGGRYEFSGDLSLPVAGLSCEDVDAYSAWLTISSPAGKAGWYFRLPTRDEWEKAARGADARIFPWGSEGRADFCRGSLPRAHLDPNGSVLEPGLRFPVDDSPFGVRDMAGNLFELCVGSYAAADLRPWCGGHKHVSWDQHSEEFHSAYVAGGNPTRPGDNDGFRLVAWRPRAAR